MAQVKTPADEAAADTDEKAIVVTGSRIARRDLESASPLSIITSRQIDSRGFQTVAQALNELPTFGVPGSSPIGGGQSNLGAGQSFVDFLGLGSQRTLTLVNSRRFVGSNASSIFGPTGSGGSQVDLNTIPTKLIDRVETVAAIGAPIYGSDAVAGTVNIILKRDFDGLDIDAQTGISQLGDAPSYRFRAIAGKNFADGRGNITLSGEYSESRGLVRTDRRSTALDSRFDLSSTGRGPQPIYADFRIPALSTTGIPIVAGGGNFLLSPQQAAAFLGDARASSLGVTNAAGQQLRFASNGSLEAIDFGGVVGPANGFSLFTNGGDGLSLNPITNLQTDIKRYSAIAQASFQATPDIRVFGEAWYTVSEGRNLAAQPGYNTGLFDGDGTRDGNLIIPLSNPFLSAASRAQIANSIANNPFSDQNNGVANQDYFFLGRANVDLSSGVSTGRSQIIRFVGGVDGNINILPAGPWSFEAFFNYGQSKVTSKNPELNQQNFLNAVNAVAGPNNTIVCAPGFTNSPIATLSSTCAPLNLFGNQVSKAARDYVTTIARPRNVANQYNGVVSVSGPLFKLPGGDFAFALGYEHRAENSKFDPGAFYFGAGTGNSSQRTSYGRSVPYDRVSGSFFTNEIFGELNAEIVSPENQVPFIYALSIQTAGRYIWNSQAGNDPTYTVQGRWAPIRDIAFRAAYTRSVRAPSIVEAFNPSSSAFGFAVDVCDQSLVNQGPNAATRLANCRAAGVPANFNALSNQRSFSTFTLGNPNLENEKADSYTAGVVLSPTFAPGFNATVDYISVNLKQAITLFGNSDVVRSCYDALTITTNPFCALLTRDPATSQLTTVSTSYFNSAALRFKGIVAAINYRRPVPALSASGVVGMDVSYQYLDTLTNAAIAGQQPVVTDNSVGYSRHKGVLNLTYDSAALSSLIQLNYIGTARTDPNLPLDFYSVSTVRPYIVKNASITYTVAKRLTFTANIDNVFNVSPPFPFPATGGNNTYFSGILGRYFRLSAGVSF